MPGCWSCAGADKLDSVYRRSSGWCCCEPDDSDAARATALAVKSSRLTNDDLPESEGTVAARASPAVVPMAVVASEGGTSSSSGVSTGVGQCASGASSAGAGGGAVDAWSQVQGCIAGVGGRRAPIQSCTDEGTAHGREAIDGALEVVVEACEREGRREAEGRERFGSGRPRDCEV